MVLMPSAYCLLPVILIIIQSAQEAEMSRDQEFMREIQKKLEKKVRENEISVLEYWKEKLDRLAVMKPEGIASLQLEIKKVSSLMTNRVKALKNE